MRKHKVDHIRDLCLYNLRYPTEEVAVRDSGRSHIGRDVQVSIHFMKMNVKHVTNGNVLRHLFMLMREDFNVHR